MIVAAVTSERSVIRVSMLVASAAIGSPVNEDGDCPKTEGGESVALHLRRPVLRQLARLNAVASAVCLASIAG